MPEITIRPAVVADAEGIARIHVVMWQHAYRGQMPDDYLNSLTVEQRLPWHIQRLTSPALRSHTLVAVVGEQVVGFSIVGQSREPDATEQTAELYAIYVDPQWMGRRVGSALMAESLVRLRAEGFIHATLWVLASNTPTIEFYERKGWAADGQTKTEDLRGFELVELRYAIDLS